MIFQIDEFGVAVRGTGHFTSLILNDIMVKPKIILNTMNKGFKSTNISSQCLVTYSFKGIKIHE